MAGTGLERFARHYPPRPPIQSQHSSSVPSTPHQQPRDRLFISRSPSPSRQLSNRSPRSVASEATGPPHHAQRAAPVVCKFETGAEIRKRRIPYVEGGNELLKRPEKEPKKQLEPHEVDKLSGDMRELYDRLLPSDESEDRRERLVKKLEYILHEEWPDNDIRVNVFGSSGNLLSSSDSDVDICITTPHSLKKLESMHSLAMLLHRHGMQKVVCRASAKVPIVKCWDPELELACDLNVNNPLALENTRMIKIYVQLDNRVRPLAKVVKYWTKQRILNDAAFGGTISSYTWICMIINFLQTRDPPILPSLQKLPEQKRSMVNGKPSEFADDLESLRGYGDANKESLGQLLFGFFRLYGYDFDYSGSVISVKEGKFLLRKDKGWETSNYHKKEARNRLCVEEPFNTFRNLGNSADDYAFSGIHQEIRRAFDLLADGCQLEKCCGQFEFPPEEKPIFQRPTPKPKPTLTRSASQSGRPNAEPGSGRSRKGGNRNQSNHRNGNRRASSGASFSNQRVPLQSPPSGGNLSDYFAARGNLHDQLYQQYQFLQAQQDVLRSQLSHQQHQTQAHAQVQSRVGDLAGSPRYHSYANGMPSPRYLDNPPQTAPLLQGYLYHYPARYPPQSSMSQARSREGTSTNPSSPSLVPAVPALRRTFHRASVPEGSSSGSIRSQSQPGRSLPHPLNLHSQAHPGTDVSESLAMTYGGLRTLQGFQQSQPGTNMPFSPSNILAQSGPVTGNAISKEYVGYYVGQSPQLGPQYATHPFQMPQMPVLRDPPQRPRRVTPDLMPPVPNGKHTSRSPSPLGHDRSYTATADVRAALAPAAPPSPVLYQEALQEQPFPSPAESGIQAPIIVNGSNTAIPSMIGKLQEDHRAQASGTLRVDVSNELGSLRHVAQSAPPVECTRTHLPDVSASAEVRPPSPRIAPSPRGKQPPRLGLSSNGTHPTDDIPETLPEVSPLTAAPLLSPVAEMRTPSPTHRRGLDSPTSIMAIGLSKSNAMPNGKITEGGSLSAPHGRQGSRNAIKGTGKSPSSPMTGSTTDTNGTANPPANAWQQATGKKHKKNKSTAGLKSSSQGNVKSGEPLPFNEFERKGG